MKNPFRNVFRREKTVVQVIPYLRGDRTSLDEVRRERWDGVVDEVRASHIGKDALGYPDALLDRLEKPSKDDISASLGLPPARFYVTDVAVRSDKPQILVRRLFGPTDVPDDEEDPS